MASRPELVGRIRALGVTASVVTIARVLDDGLGRPVEVFDLISFIKEAFPEVPLRLVIEVGLWRRFSSGGLSDDQVNELLTPWIPGTLPTTSTKS